MKKITFLLGIVIFSLQLNAQVYREVNKIVAFDREADDQYGYSVAISGNYAVVGSWQEDHDINGANYKSNSGAAYIYEKDISGNWIEIQKIVASDRINGASFGGSVAIDGNYIVVGAQSDDFDASGANFMSSAGSAYIFERDGTGVWNEVQKIVASDRNTSDNFGYSVTVNGNYAIIGAVNEDEDEAGANTLAEAGSAYIFERNGTGVWNEVQKIVASDRGASDGFGISVSVDGTYAVIGAYWDAEDASGANPMTGAGSAYIFERDGAGVWNETQKIVAIDRASFDRFGSSVSISANYVIVGAWGEDEDASGANTISGAGSAYIFGRDGFGIWGLMQKIVASDRSLSAQFGRSVSIDGIHASIGAYSESKDASGGNPVSGAGAAYVLEYNGSVWAEVDKIVASDRAGNDYFGYAVAISGSNIIASADYEDEDALGGNTLAEAGSAYIFEYCATVGSTTVTACDSYTSPSGNYTWISSGSYIDTIPNVAGCDSILTINLTINYSNTGTDVISSCNPYTWIDGITYSTSNNTATYTLTNAAGCDSVVTLDLTINSNTGINTIIACDSYTWIDGITYTSSNNTATHTLTNVAGCDSVVTLDLTINYSNTGTDVITACDSYTWIDGITYTSSNNTATHTLTNAVGCDSVVTLDLTINYSNTGTDVITACNNYTWIDGITYTSSNNTATYTLTNAVGCDSLVTLDLTINYSNTGTDVITACDSYTWIDGITYTSSNNTATYTLTNAAGCDSVVTLDLRINYSNTGTDVITTCNPYTWIDGITYTSSNNTATYTLTNAAGCDSVVTLDLTINSNTGTDVITACDSYTWIDGITYTSSNNTAIYTLTNVAGCDSVVTLDLTIDTVDAGVTVNDPTITANATGATYQWIDCNNANSIITGETNASYTATANGDYAVIVTQNTCTDTSACVNINSVEVIENSIVSGLEIYPNPTSGVLTIEFQKDYSSIEVGVTNILGEYTETYHFRSTDKAEITITGAKGFYFVKIIADKKETATFKVLKY